jgi:hypothetical protein
MIGVDHAAVPRMGWRAGVVGAVRGLMAGVAIIGARGRGRRLGAVGSRWMAGGPWAGGLERPGAVEAGEHVIGE